MTVSLRLFALIFGLAFAACAHSQSNELSQISNLLKHGHRAEALARVDRYLAAKPGDPQGRFLKGLILTEEHKDHEAIEVFTKLTHDYPDLPEPYNNLAVLYAAQGHYEKARHALEQSIRTHPSYATAYENLGDIYTKLASQSYDKALQLDSTNTSAQTKLSLVREIILSGNRRVPGVPPQLTAKAAAPTAVEKPTTAPVAKATAPVAKATKPAKTSVPPKAPAIAKAPPQTAAASAKTAKPVREENPQTASRDALLKAVHAWARAWSDQNVASYLASYARDFKPAHGASRAAWERLRRRRLTAPKHIDVQLDRIKIDEIRGDRATVSFLQHYRSNTFKVNTFKRLVMVREGGKWLIQQEHASN